ncbi:LL-diaminopimelate aminotransferase [Tuberibacillus sp. Marseille-P3662]|uniref:LL-diaminopimelate aminotransferase n=1 Tax=Tuberibacillus sp. Marseille-P3662 TaxID=1965358 RepID=UPI000A1CD3FF|nr:LL-diaminopimelate aminotransferase [Tuberibacillus sp. Marseille-P3662]
MNIKTADRMDELPPYLFDKINGKKQRLKATGHDLLDLGIGDPDLPTPDFIKERLVQELDQPGNHKYSGFSGCLEFREAVADFYQKKFHVHLDPDSEVLALIGSKEGVAHFVFSMIDRGDEVMIPDPSYPVYRMATHLAGGKVRSMPLKPDLEFQPDFAELSEENYKAVKLAFLNYPGNPTGATVDLDFFAHAVRFFRQRNVILAHDSAYNLVTYDGYQAPSILQVDGAKDAVVEFGSLSKGFNMTGWRIGYIVGNADLINTLKTVKSNLDSSQFLPIQKAAATALTSDLSALNDRNDIYSQRADVLIEGLRKIGIDAGKPKGSIFIWARVPEGYTSAGFSEVMMEEAGVVVTPGVAFGTYGEGYFRMSLSVPEHLLREAVRRMQVYL